MNKGKYSLIKALGDIGSKICLDLAKDLESKDSSKTTLHLRSAELGTNDLKILCRAFSDINSHQDFTITSLSLSFNPNIRDQGVLFLLENTPLGLMELGLVGCHLTDTSGEKLLDWLSKNQQLKMLCAEKNDFSKELRLKFKNQARAVENLYLDM